METPEEQCVNQNHVQLRRSGGLFANFEQILHIALVFPSLIFNNTGLRRYN